MRLLILILGSLATACPGHKPSPLATKTFSCTFEHEGAQEALTSAVASCQIDSQGKSGAKAYYNAADMKERLEIVSEDEITPKTEFRVLSFTLTFPVPVDLQGVEQVLKDSNFHLGDINEPREPIYLFDSIVLP